MKADLLIKNISQLATCASGDGPKRGASMKDAGVIREAAIAISNGRFVAIGETAALASAVDAAAVLDADGRAACPGFVDPHTHLVFGGDRLDEFEQRITGAEYLEILAAGGGILSTVGKTRAAPAEDLTRSALDRLRAMLANGTTTCEVKTGYGLTTESELKMLDVILGLAGTQPVRIVPTFLAAHAVPAEYRDDLAKYVDLVCDDMLPAAKTRLASSDGPFFADVFCENGAFDLGSTERILVRAKDLGFGLKAHVDEFTNLGGSRLAIDLGATSIDHLDAISEEEIALLSNAATVGVVTPTVNFNFGRSDFADARRLLDSNCAVALSTDYNPGSAPCSSQPMAMAIACRYQKLLPFEALNASTINAAYAVGLGDEVGSVEIGKRADLLLLDAADPRVIAYEFGSSPVSSVIIGGRRVL